jgi:hypothetical protein
MGWWLAAVSNWQIAISQSKTKKSLTATGAKDAKETGNNDQRLSAQIRGKGFWFYFGQLLTANC